MPPKIDPLKIGEDCECYSEVHTKKSCPVVKNVTHPLVRLLYIY